LYEKDKNNDNGTAGPGDMAQFYPLFLSNFLNPDL
jgi:hypothetical protein